MRSIQIKISAVFVPLKLAFHQILHYSSCSLFNITYIAICLTHFSVNEMLKQLFVESKTTTMIVVAWLSSVPDHRWTCDLQQYILPFQFAPELSGIPIYCSTCKGVCILSVATHASNVTKLIHAQLGLKGAVFIPWMVCNMGMVSLSNFGDSFYNEYAPVRLSQSYINFPIELIPSPCNLSDKA